MPSGKRHNGNPKTFPRQRHILTKLQCLHAIECRVHIASREQVEWTRAQLGTKGVVHGETTHVGSGERGEDGAVDVEGGGEEGECAHVFHVAVGEENEVDLFEGSYVSEASGERAFERSESDQVERREITA